MAQPQTSQAPQTLPANFAGWDKAPATLPANFSQWDETGPPADKLPKSWQKAQPTSDESAFLKSNSGYTWLPPDNNFPQREPGIYPTGPGNEWRTDPKHANIDQSPVDLQFGKHTYEGVKSGLAAATAPLAMEATVPQLVGGVAGGTVGTVAGSQAAKAAGAGETGQEVAGDVGGVVGGGVGGGAGDWAATRARAIYSALPESIQKEFVGLLSPRLMHAAKIADILGLGKGPEPVYPGASLPEHPGTFPGASQPTATPEQLNPALVSPARTLPGQIPPEVTQPAQSGPIPGVDIPPSLYRIRPDRGLMLSGDVAPQAAAPGSAGSIAESVTPQPMTPSGAGIPRTLSGESALRDVLSRQDNANLLKIARSRGINVTQEAQLKSGVADKRLISKIADDFSDDELDEFRSTYIEATRMGRHDFGDIGPEANKTMALQTYFPDIKIPASVLKRTSAATSTPQATNDDELLNALQESLKLAKASKAQ